MERHFKILIYNLNKGQLKINEINNDLEIIEIPYNKNFNLYQNIGFVGIEIEKRMIEYSNVWSTTQKYESVMILWDNSDVVIESKLIDKIKDLRGDEVIFNTVHEMGNLKWVVGHPRAVITWSAGVCKIESLKLNDKLDFFNFYEYKKELIWFATRIGLKTYGLK